MRLFKHIRVKMYKTTTTKCFNNIIKVEELNQLKHTVKTNVYVCSGQILSVINYTKFSI